MEVLILSLLTILLATAPLMNTAWLSASPQKELPHMAGQIMVIVMIARATILIGRTKHTITSPLTCWSGSSNCSNELRETIVDNRDLYFALLGVCVNLE